MLQVALAKYCRIDFPHVLWYNTGANTVYFMERGDEYVFN